MQTIYKLSWLILAACMVLACDNVQDKVLKGKVHYMRDETHPGICFAYVKAYTQRADDVETLTYVPCELAFPAEAK